MKIMLRHILLLLSLFVLQLVKAQDEYKAVLEVDWAAYAQDTLMPVFGHSIDLGYDHEHREYSVSLEYPELTPLTAEEIERYRLPETSGLPEWPVVNVTKGISAKRGQLDISFVPIIWRDGKYLRMQDFVLKTSSVVVQKVGVSCKAPSELLESREEQMTTSLLSTGRWVKIRVADNGIHMLTHTQLKKMGFSDPSKVRLYGYGGHLLSESDTESWRDDLCETYLYHGNDRLIFYACGPVSWNLREDNTFVHTVNPYAKYGYYFLTEAETSQIPASRSKAAAEISVHKAADTNANYITTTPAYALHEVDDYAWYHGGRKLVESYDYSSGNVRTYQFDVPDAAPSSKGYLDVCFTHNGSTSTTLSVTAGGVQLGSFSLTPVGSHSTASATSRVYPVSIENATYSVKLTHNRGAGISGRLDYLRLSYVSGIVLGKPFYATRPGINSYAIGGADEHTIVWDITDPAAPSEVPCDFKGNMLTFSTENAWGDTYIAFDPRATYPMPEEVGEVPNQNLRGTEPTDYTIIVPASGKLRSQAERLAQVHRERNALAVKVVSADEVYNEFSSGTPDATAYRRYLKMLYDRAESAEQLPKYLLLFGDGAWDNRMLSSAWDGCSPDDYLLCYESEESFSATSAYVVDDYFGLLDNGEGANLKTDKVDIGIGRFPVTTVEQARDVVDKVVAYIQNANAGAWKNTILMLGDDGDDNRHMADAEKVAKMLENEYPDYMVKRVYWDAFPMEATSTGNSYPAVRKRLLELLKEGALMVNYSGHGAPDVISHELVINKSDMEQLSSPRLPVWVTASCDITPFDNSASSFGENAFLNPRGGVIALMTSTRTTYAEQNRRLNHFFSKYVFARDDKGRRMSLGDAMRMAKCSLITSGVGYEDTSGNKLNYVLIGDPALVVGNADYSVVVDELNGVPVGEGQDVVLKAGSEVVVKGHVNGMEGAAITDFSGVLHVSVFDNLETVLCRNNANVQDLEPFSYRERTKRIFVGSDSINNGYFTFTFRIPMDINYSMESGLINLYAVDDTRQREAKGACDAFLLGGTDESLNNDGEGPQVQLYLNSPDFITGGQVNETPRLVVLLEDADGINTSGNMGHDLVAVVDGKPSMRYELNEYYTSSVGEYTRGMVAYVLPELEEGMHTLTFRAWDMMNNSTTVTIEFEVVKGLTPHISQIQATHNPARDYTIFEFTHDRPENEVSVTVEVFDFSGRVLWKHEERVVSIDNSYSLSWNLCASLGAPLSSGVYLYRVTVASPSGKSTSQAQKLVILR